MLYENYQKKVDFWPESVRMPVFMGDWSQSTFSPLSVHFFKTGLKKWTGKRIVIDRFNKNLKITKKWTGKWTVYCIGYQENTIQAKSPLFFQKNQ